MNFIFFKNETNFVRKMSFFIYVFFYLFLLIFLGSVHRSTTNHPYLHFRYCTSHKNALLFTLSWDNLDKSEIMH